MGLLDWVRQQKLRMDGWPVADDSEIPPILIKLWKAAVLVLPATVTDCDVEDGVRLWCPEGLRMTGGHLAFDVYTLSLVGYDEDLWEDADLPANCPRAYLLGFEGTSDPRSWQDEQIGYDLLRGLARRLDGNCRPNVEMPWDAPGGEPVDPWVYAPRTLSPEEGLDLLAPHLIDPTIVFRADSGEYRIDADGLIMWCDPLTPTAYPNVMARSWYDTARDVAEYQFVSDPAAGGPERADTVARILAAETGGIVLDEDGFPWP